MRKPFIAALLSSLVMGCPSSPKQDAPAAVSQTPEPTASAAALPEPSAPASAASAGLVKEPTLADLLAKAPSEGTRRSETIFGAGGVYAGLAPDWSTQDVYNVYLIASTKKDKAMVYLDTERGWRTRRWIASLAPQPIRST